MLDSKVREKITQNILNVYDTRQPLPLLTQTYPDITVEDAYAIQEAFINERVSQGRRIRGYKVGLTSKVMQEMSGATEPDYSAMTDDQFLDEDTPLSAAQFFYPLIEIEIAFVMKDALKGPGISTVDVIRATDFVLPAIEIVDFRVGPAQGMNVIDTIADLAACGATVLGCNPMDLKNIDIRDIHGEMLINGEVIQEGYSSAVLGNPVTSVAWLANKMGTFGVSFNPGEVILTGSFVRAMPVKAGDEVVARFSHGFGNVKTSFI